MNYLLLGSILLLALLLFIPVSKLIWILSVRRMETKLGGVELSEIELQAQLKRARFISSPLTLVFSWFFHAHVLGASFGG